MATEKHGGFGRGSPARRAVERFFRNRGAAAALVVAGLVIGSAVLAPLIAPRRGLSQDLAEQFRPPSLEHPFGTDDKGRDMLARVLYGGRISLAVAAAGTLVSLVAGVGWGLIAGYAGGRTEWAMMRIVDVLYSLPYTLLVILLIAVCDQSGLKAGIGRLLGPVGLGGWWESVQFNLVFLFVALGLVQWLTMARVVRSRVKALKVGPAVESAAALGAGHFWIMRRHILPHVLPVVIACATLTLPSVMLQEAFISFLGLGVQPPAASWGTLVADGVRAVNPIEMNWWLILFPSLVLSVALLALNQLGDALQEALAVGT